MRRLQMILPAFLIATSAACASSSEDVRPADTTAETTTTAPEVAQTAPTEFPRDVLLNEEGVAAQGYDVVSYLADNAAAAGSASHSAKHGGATYLFTSAEHKMAFESNPEKYLPAYGGFCAFAVAAKQAKVPPNPETFRVQDGRVLLFFNGPFDGNIVDTSQMWDKDATGMLRQADENWPSVRDQ